MTTSGISRLWNYIGECVRLLYWAFFKPYTFRKWLSEIDPDLKLTDNPFAKRAEFHKNPKLRRYAGQVWWLSAVVPIFAVLLIALLYSMGADEPFNFYQSSLFLWGWWLGLLMARGGNEKLRNYWFYGFIFLSVGISLLISVGTQFTPELTQTILQTFSFIPAILRSDLQVVAFIAAFSIMLSTVLIVVSSIASGLVLGLIWGIALNIIITIMLLILIVVLNATWDIVIDGTLILIFSNLTLSILLFVLIITTFNSILSVVIGVSPISLYILISISISILFGITYNIKSGILLALLLSLGVLRIYCWFPELLLMVLLTLFAKQGYAARVLCYLPPRFDEQIILPLPFMDTLIIEAYAENPSAARQTIDYLITSTNQQTVAAKAMVGIAIDSLTQCRNLSEIVAIADQLAWLPSPPPAQLGEILPQFLEISQTVRSAETATSRYRQKEILTQTLTTLRKLRDSLAFSKDAALATAFGSIAERWFSLLQTAQNTLAEQASQSAEIPLVYIAGSALDPETATNRFKGRIDIFRQIENLALATQPPVLLLYGGRRAGKTSALKYLPYKVGSELVPLLVDLQGVADATKLHSVALSLATQITHAAQKARNLRLPTPDAYSFQDDPFPALREWFSQVERTAPNKRFLLCLDEFERLSEVVESTGSRAPLNFLRHILQHRHQWILLFSGSHTLDELDPYWSDYLINTQSLRVSYLHQTEAQELIVEPVPDFPKIYEPEAVQAILSLTRCHPYLVQLTCYVLVEFLNRKAKATQTSALTLTATASDVHSIIPQVIETGGMYFRELWTTTLNDQERLLITQILAGHLPAASDQALVKKLVQKEVLERDGKTFQVPLVQRYFEQVVQV